VNRESTEKRILECSQKLDKMNKEIDLERKKGTRLTKENISLKKELDILKAKIDGDNNPDVLKGKIIDLNAKIVNMKKDIPVKAKEI
jgi:ATP-dependent 26S proteasome regulatory subunit